MRLLEARLVAASAVVTCLASLALATGGLADAPPAPDTHTWVANGTVYSVARADGRTFIGGDFSSVARRVGTGVQLSADGAGAPDPARGTFPEVGGGDVRVAVPDGSNGWYIGGDFTSVGGHARSGAAHLVPEGDNLKVSGWNPNVAGGSVTAIGPAGGVVYLGGSFKSVGGDGARQNVAAVDAGAGAVVADWKPVLDGPVHALQVRTFQINRGDPPTPTPTDVVIVGGEFTKIGETSRQRIGAIWGSRAVNPADGTSWAGTMAPWTPNVTGPVRALAVTPVVESAPGQQQAAVFVGSDGLVAIKLWLKGDGTGGSGTPAPSNSGAYNTWSPQPGCTGCTLAVRALALSPDLKTLYVGGDFTTIGQNSPKPLRQSAAALAAIPDPRVAPLANAAKADEWNPSPDGRVRALATNGTDVYIGGDFNQINGVGRPGLAAFEATPEVTTIRGWNPNVSGGAPGADAGVVNTLAAVPGGARVYAGGSFVGVDAVGIGRLAAFDSAGELIQSWNPNPNESVRALTVAGGILYFGGDFTQVGGQGRDLLAAVNASDGSLTGWAPAVTTSTSDPRQVMTLTSGDGTVYVGGRFTHLGGQPRANAGAVGTDGAVRPWDPGADDNVRALAYSCGALYAGGSFKEIGGKPRLRVAVLHPASGAATSWKADANSAVHALARAGDLLYIGGQFSMLSSAPRPRLAAVSAATGKATGWTPNVAGTAVRALAVPAGGSVVYAGGTFTSIGGEERSNIGAVSRASGAPTGWNPGAVGTVRTLAAGGDALYVGGSFRGLGAIMQRGFGAFAYGADPATPSADCHAPITDTSTNSNDSDGVPAPPAAGPPPDPPPAPIVDTLGPVFAKVSLKPRRFRVVRPQRKRTSSAARRAPKRTKIRYTLSEPATVVARFDRRLRKRCSRKVRARSPKKRCYRWSRVKGRRIYKGAVAGKNVNRFNGRFKQRYRVRGESKTRVRYLTRGRYRLRLKAIDAVKNRSTTVRKRFRIVRR